MSLLLLLLNMHVNVDIVQLTVLLFLCFFQLGTSLSCSLKYICCWNCSLDGHGALPSQACCSLNEGTIDLSDFL
jgi:hypothetical protein